MARKHKLSEAEAEIMEAIWEEKEPVTSARLLELFREREWKGQTISTFLSRLVDKGLLTVRRRGRTNFYTPAMDRTAYRARLARELVDSQYNGSVRGFLTTLYSGEQLSETELEDLRRWFQEVSGDA